MTNLKRPLAAVAVAATLNLTVTGVATAQATAVTPDTTRAAGSAAQAPPQRRPKAGTRSWRWAARGCQWRSRRSGAAARR